MQSPHGSEPRYESESPGEYGDEARHVLANHGGAMAQLGHVLRDHLRSWLKIRRPRDMAPRGPKPRIGAIIYRGEVRITVQAGLSDELWQWLLDAEWRELMYRPDRRRYREVPPSMVTRLIDALPESRERILAIGISRAAYRPDLRTMKRLAR